MEPLFYDPHISGGWGVGSRLTRPGDRSTHSNRDRAKDPGHPNQKYVLLEPGRRHRCQRGLQRSKRFAELDLTHIAHLLEPDGKLVTWTGIKDLASSKGTQPPCTREDFDTLCSGIPKCWYQVLDRGVRGIQKTGEFKILLKKDSGWYLINVDFKFKSSFRLC